MELPPHHVRLRQIPRQVRRAVPALRQDEPHQARRALEPALAQDELLDGVRRASWLLDRLAIRAHLELIDARVESLDLQLAPRLKRAELHRGRDLLAVRWDVELRGERRAIVEAKSDHAYLGRLLTLPPWRVVAEVDDLVRDVPATVVLVGFVFVEEHEQLVPVLRHRQAAAAIVNVLLRLLAEATATVPVANADVDALHLDVVVQEQLRHALLEERL